MEKLIFCFKIGVPRQSELYQWGDYYFAQSFGEELERRGHRYFIQILPEWDTDEDAEADVVVHLRGLSKYKVKPHHFNIMWNISHPQAVSIDEYEKYDLILISSLQHTERIKKAITKPVFPLLQFTDTNIFYPELDQSLKSELLFVGNSRAVMRRVIKDIIPPPRELSIYGTKWEKLIPHKYIKDNWFPNEKLRLLYSSCEILLNDHWDDMKEYGFINNRIFDAMACKAVTINDDFSELKEVLPCALTYQEREDLLKLIEDIDKEPKKYRLMAEENYQLVMENHTVKQRVDQILTLLAGFEGEIENKKILYEKPAGIKNKVRNAILKFLGYGRIYVFAQKLYQRYKYFGVNSKRRRKEWRKFSDKVKRRLLPGFGLKASINFCTEAEIRDLARRIADPISTEGELPLISIIVPNKNGLKYLKDLIPALEMNTLYSNYELLIIDNESSDGSKKYISRLDQKHIKFISTGKNLNFSESINFGVEKAKGDFLVFLNNDTMPLYGWLDELYSTFTKQKDVGIVGSRLIYNEIDARGKKGELVYPGCSVQHDGIKFSLGLNTLTPKNLGKYKNPLEDNYRDNTVVQLPAVTAACLFTDRETFTRVKGFDPSYYFGREDVDFCLKVLDLGKKVLLNKKSLVFHREFSSQIKTGLSTRKKWRTKNEEIFRHKWLKTVYKQIWQEKLENKSDFWTDHPLHVGFLVTEFSPHTTAGDLFSANGLGEGLKSIFAYEVSYFPRRPVYEWDEIPEAVDILIAMRHDFDIRKSEISPKTIKVAWIRGYITDWLNKPWIHNYDGIIVSSTIARDMAVQAVGKSKVWGVVPLGLTQDFLAKIDIKANNMAPERDIDVSFAGNIFEIPRDIVTNLDVSVGFNFHFYGRLEGGPNHPWRPFHKGSVDHAQLPEIYKRTKIVIEDTAPFNLGTVNLRVYEAAACGALVIANYTPGLEEIFGETILMYKDKQDLTAKLTYYLANEEERKALAEKARTMVLNHHTFNHRAKVFKDILSKVLAE